VLETADADAGGIDTGLIRDVLLNQDAYKDFLVQAYESAWEDGVISKEELAELKSFQEALGISDEEAAGMSVKAAIKSAASDGEISAEEAKAIDEAAREAKMSPEDVKEALDEELSKKD